MIEFFKAKIRGRIGGQLSKTIFKNSSLNAFRTVLLAILSFVTIPIILHKLGAENYGVWALVIAFASYSNFLELGFNSAVTRLVASSNFVGSRIKKETVNDNNVEIAEDSDSMENDKLRNDSEYVADQINSTVITYILVSSLIFLLVLFFYPLIRAVMFKNVTAPYIDLFILGTLFFNLVNLVTSNYFSVLTGRMRMDVTNGITIFVNIIQTGLTIWLLFAGQGLMAIFAGSVAAAILNSVLPVYFAKREFPELFFSFKRYSFSKIKHLFKFSLKMYFINSVSNFLTATNKFIIVRLTGLDFVAYYEIANKVVLQLRILFQNILEPVYPATAVVVSEDGRQMTDDGLQSTDNGKSENRNKTITAYNKAFKYLLTISVLGYGAMILLSYPVFLVWLGEKFAQVSLITIIIGIGNFVNLQTAIPFFFLSVLDRLQKALWSAIFVVACNFAFGLLGYYLFGFYGLITGFSLALILPSIWFIGVGKKEVLKS